MPQVLEIDIKKAWYNKEDVVLKDFYMKVNKGETVAIVGPSGIGKTTVLSIIAGLHKDFEGSIKIPDSGRIALVTQRHSVLPWKTVLQNIMLLKKYEDKKASVDKAKELAASLGLESLIKRYPLRISGGQYQRVALGQAFFYEPDILLMDEPFSALDTKTKIEIMDLYLKMIKEKNIISVFVTHNMEEANYLDAGIIDMDGRYS